MHSIARFMEINLTTKWLKILQILKYLRNDNGGRMILIVPQFIMQSKLYSKLLHTKNYTTFQENVRSCFKHVSSHSVCPTELNKLEINDACMLLCSLSTSHLTGNFSHHNAQGDILVSCSPLIQLLSVGWWYHA